jgi:hypothetical protein
MASRNNASARSSITHPVTRACLRRRTTTSRSRRLYQAVAGISVLVRRLWVGLVFDGACSRWVCHRPSRRRRGELTRARVLGRPAREGQALAWRNGGVTFVWLLAVQKTAAIATRTIESNPNQLDRFRGQADIVNLGGDVAESGFPAVRRRLSGSGPGDLSLKAGTDAAFESNSPSGGAAQDGRFD